MRTFLVCAAFAAALVPASARAQTVTLTEAQVLAQLGVESPRVRAARAAVDVARADMLAAGRWPNPRATFNREAVAGVAENMFMIAQPLPVTGRRRLEVSAAAARADASSSRADDQIRRVRADLRLAFTDLWAAQERERELARSRDRLTELAEIVGRSSASS
jgi:outer membrane protein TolC